MKIGLDDVVAAETVLSDVDGLAGRLIIRGLSLDEAAGLYTFEDMLTVLWDGLVAVDGNLLGALAAARIDVYQHWVADLPRYARMPVFDAMRAIMACLPDTKDDGSALALAAAPAVLLPALLRLSQGASPIAPRTGLSHAADMLRMLTGTDPAPVQVAALDTYLVTVCDHGLNASTFAARVVASTGAGLVSAALAALGALKGPLHGGAPGPVLDMLDTIGEARNAGRILAAMLDDGVRLPGFGHRIYRVRDPRADALAKAIARLSEAGHVDPDRMALARAVETEALAALHRRKPDRVLETNVEFYTALLLDALGFPREAFTAVFAAGRIGGWIAHAEEQTRSGRLIRPRSVYVGPLPREAA
jgi:citrate synthase